MKRIFPLLSLLILVSCYNTKKAEKQVNKALLNYPDAVATIARNAFPCTTTKLDTVSVTDTIIEVAECPEQDYIINTNHDTVWIDKVATKIIKVPIKVPVRTVTITKTIEDSAKIKLLQTSFKEMDAVIIKQNATIEAQDKKIARKNKELWIYRSLLFLLFLYMCYRLYRNLTTIKFKM
jgi:hypothetical protein